MTVPLALEHGNQKPGEYSTHTDDHDEVGNPNAPAAPKRQPSQLCSRPGSAEIDSKRERHRKPRVPSVTNVRCKYREPRWAVSSPPLTAARRTSPWQLVQCVAHGGRQVGEVLGE